MITNKCTNHWWLLSWSVDRNKTKLAQCAVSEPSIMYCCFACFSNLVSQVGNLESVAVFLPSLCSTAQHKSFKYKLRQIWEKEVFLEDLDRDTQSSKWQSFCSSLHFVWKVGTTYSRIWQEQGIRYIFCHFKSQGFEKKNNTWDYWVLLHVFWKMDCWWWIDDKDWFIFIMPSCITSLVL